MALFDSYLDCDENEPKSGNSKKEIIIKDIVIDDFIDDFIQDIQILREVYERE